MTALHPRIPRARARGPSVGALLLLASLGSSAGCRPSVDPVAALEPTDVVTGWFDAGIVEGGKNKLVPSVSLKLRNKSGEPVRSIQINAIFRRVGETEMWGEHFGWAVPRAGLPPGEITNQLVLQSALGYTSDTPRLQMLQNSQFVDAKVELFLKQGSQVWAKLAEYPIQRQLLTR
ncbi:MAG TPA: hypothetical protein VM820_01950 [Vicinamibacterales bacterium]|jgi:hypothetical protein|nr:hypothetical protein [Vicinamibacterales bacterium]